jgi:hypothetical protein
MVGFTPLQPQRSFPYPLNRRLGETHRRSVGVCETIIGHLCGVSNLGRPARRVIAVRAGLSRLMLLFAKYCMFNLFVENQNSIQEEIESRLKSGNACYHSAQNLLSSSLLSRNLKIKIYRTIIFACCFAWV